MAIFPPPHRHRLSLGPLRRLLLPPAAQRTAPGEERARRGAARARPGSAWRRPPGQRQRGRRPSAHRLRPQVSGTRVAGANTTHTTTTSPAALLLPRFSASLLLCARTPARPPVGPTYEVDVDPATVDERVGLAQGGLGGACVMVGDKAKAPALARRPVEDDDALGVGEGGRRSARAPAEEREREREKAQQRKGSR